MFSVRTRDQMMEVTDESTGLYALVPLPTLLHLILPCNFQEIHFIILKSRRSVESEYQNFEKKRINKSSLRNI